MTTLSSLIGSKVLSRANAETVGDIHDVVIDVNRRAVTAWQVGKGRKAAFVRHEHLTGAGGAAIVISDESHLQAASTPEEQATAKGARSVLGAKVLSDTGDLMGEVTDVEIDPASGEVLGVHTTSGDIAADRMRGLGSFALVVAAVPAAS